MVYCGFLETTLLLSDWAKQWYVYVYIFFYCVSVIVFLDNELLFQASEVILA